MDAVTARGHFAIFTPTQARGEQLRPEIRLEQMRMLVESQKLPLPYAFPLLMVPYAACFLSFIAWYWLSVPVVLVLLANWFHRSVLHAFVKAHPDPADIEKWEYRFIAAGFLLSLSLASTSIFLWVPDDAVQQSFVLTALLVTLAPMALLTSCYMPSFYATVIPIAAAAAIRLVTSGELLQIGLAAILVVFTAFLAQLCTKVNGIMLHSITLREDKTGLIDQLFAAKRESDAARARAEEASRAKSHFLANMSHELRTPLNAIIGFSEVMASEIFGKHANPTYKEYANDINRSGQHLLGLINDVLDLSRIEAGRFQITEEDVSITELAEDSRRILEIRAQAQHVTIVEDYEPGLPVVHGDARALRHGSIC